MISTSLAMKALTRTLLCSACEPTRLSPCPPPSTAHQLSACTPANIAILGHPVDASVGPQNLKDGCYGLPTRVHLCPQFTYVLCQPGGHAPSHLFAISCAYCPFVFCVNLPSASTSLPPPPLASRWRPRWRLLDIIRPTTCPARRVPNLMV
jgi:hypothetical protein